MSDPNQHGGFIPDDTPLVELEDVVLRFGPKTVLDGISLEVGRQERVVVMGQSGGGKSTLLRLVMGILTPTSGTVRFGGRPVNQLGRREVNALRARIGMVYQYSALISSLNVRDNLALPLEELSEKTAAEIEATIDEKLELVRMSEVKTAMPAELSGGMKKRIALARALVLEPELILFDEPSAGLDPVTSSVVDELIIELTDQTKVTSIIVTHEMDSAFRIATRMVMLYEGRFIADGPPASFKDSTNPVVAQFVTGKTVGPMTATPGDEAPKVAGAFAAPAGATGG